MLKSRSILGIRSVGYSLKMSDNGFRLEYNLLSMLTHFEGKVRILIICRSESLIKSADFLPEIGADHDGCT